LYDTWRVKIFKPLFYKGFKKLARVLLYLFYNKNKKCSNPIKTKRTGSDITRTTRTETQLTDFFGVDSFSEQRARHAVRNRTENNKTASRQRPDRLDRFDKSVISAQKNTFALDPEWGSLKKDVKGKVDKNNNRPPEKQKRA